MDESPEVVAARKEERIHAQLQAHADDIKELRAGQAQTAHTLGELRAQVGRVEQKINESAAAAAAVAKAATDTANKAISGRQFAIGVLAVLAPLLALLISALAGGHL